MQRRHQCNNPANCPVCRRTAQRTAQRTARRAAGQCERCMNSVCAGSRRFCQFHLDSMREQNAREMARQRAEGIYVSCPRPAVPGLTRCEVYQVQRQRQERIQRTDRLRQGLCTRGGCSNPAGDSTQLCHYHRIQHEITRHRSEVRRFATGLCVYCSNPVVPGMTVCEHHCEASQSTQERYQHNVAGQAHPPPPPAPEPENDEEEEEAEDGFNYDYYDFHDYDPARSGQGH
ncbi:uncharacterized protein F4822DRAFT_415640 [Hypoxylon trugodes]|uniref:uncharacterized protein n=1 Tax=Hypoxylon trugodes TaxID=326681 RepID=UPI00219659C5|nr:uncharacterized protein F4822DRAFT_415640 [Hypoxylon trugodes]KAI1384588.1 hypothetical protein F4822DRAFT_415640 [Hypoxylon trugodes]